jgi:hypothetical protein
LRELPCPFLCAITILGNGGQRPEVGRDDPTFRL